MLKFFTLHHKHISITVRQNYIIASAEKEIMKKKKHIQEGWAPSWGKKKE